MKSSLITRVCVILTCFLLLTAPLYPQTGNNDAVAIKFDEFGDVYPTDAAARLDNFANELQNQPDTRGFIIVYRSYRDLPGISSRHLNWMRSYLIYNRGFKADRIVAIDGGPASCLSHEFWIVPRGAAPKPRADAYTRRLDNTDVARKYDEYHYTIPEDVLESYSTEYENGLDGFAQALRKEPRALAYIIAYEGYRVNKLEETAWRELRSKKAELVKSYGISPSRVKLINGGYRRWRQIELWVVPRGAHPPIATPHIFPPQRKKR